MSEKFDVFSVGRSTIRIYIITTLKGLSLKDAFEQCLLKEMEGLKVYYVHLKDIIASKKAGGRYKGLDDI